MSYEFFVKADGERLDIYLSNKLEDMSRSAIKKLILKNDILVNGKNEKPSYFVELGDIIKVNIPIEKPLELKPEAMDLNIVYEDEDLAIINKPLNLVVHPGDKNPDGTLANGLLYHFDNLSSIGANIRPGIVHRLDKDTSGLLVIAKNDFSHKHLASGFKNRDIKRVYILIVRGVLERDKGTIDEPIGRDEKNRTKMVVNYKNGRRAITHYRVKDRFDKFTLVEARLETGRTHQIRAHFSHINHPILGDHVYYPGKMPFAIKHQLLHCIKLGFIHPRTGIYMEFKTEIPQRFKVVIDQINNVRWYDENKSKNNG